MEGGGSGGTITSTLASTSERVGAFGFEAAGGAWWSDRSCHAQGKQVTRPSSETRGYEPSEARNLVFESAQPGASRGWTPIERRGHLGFETAGSALLSVRSCQKLKHQSNHFFCAEQPAPAPHLAPPEGCAAQRIVLPTVPRVSPSCQHSQILP